MPSFYSDDLGHTLHDPFFQPDGGHRLSHERLPVKAWPPHQHSISNDYQPISLPQYESMNGGMNGGMNGVRPAVDGEMFNDKGLNSLSNGRSSSSSWDNRSSQNGSAFSANGTPNGLTENGRKSPIPPKSMSTERNSFGSMNGSMVHPSTVDMTTSATSTIVNGDHGAAKQSTIAPSSSPLNPLSTGPLTYTSPVLPPTTLSGSQPVTPSRGTGHRFSSPPAYPPPAPPGSTYAAIINGSQHPGAGQLKHRHTLQVPKLGPPRSSTEDAATSSGRFSPTITSGIRRGSLSLVRRNTRSIHSDLPHEEIVQDEDALRWAEAIRQKRASKRKRKDEEDEDRVVVGTKVDQNHVNWVTAYNMLTGIRFTVSRTNAKLDRPLTDADFAARHKFSFDITGNELTPSAKYDFKFKDYAPWVFRHLRATFKLDPADYLMSLTSKYILSELGSPGKSGSFFYFSRDYKYIIKTIHHAEHKLLRRILKDYYNHVTENPNTLLSQFYGLHRVKIPYGRKIHFVVMNNLFPPHRDIHQTFDLKGSTIGRNFKEEDLESNPRATLKDLNWLRRNYHLEFGPDKKHVFLEQMEKDVHLLQKLRIMDYSMLVGIHDLEKGNQENLRDKTLRVFQPGGDTSPDDIGPSTHPILIRTPSKLENARKARELREMIKAEKPIPMEQSSSRMPDQMEENEKREFTFYSDDGGFQATHDDNRPGDEIYYLGIIDLLTHYGTVKRLEHFWKGLSHDKHQISPIPPVPYGDRFIKFITGITKSREEAERQAAAAAATVQTDGVRSSESARWPRESQSIPRTNTDQSVMQGAEHEAMLSERRGANENAVPDRILTTIRSPSVERNNDRVGTTLPIVDEVGESSSTGGRSGKSNTEQEDDHRPPTPPKHQQAEFLVAPPVPPKPLSIRSRRSCDSNKALPALPKSESPEEMVEGELIVV